MSLVRFSQGTEAQIIATPIQEGHLYFASDKNIFAYDIDNTRHWIKDTSDTVRYNTTEYWTNQISFIPEKGQIVIYSDYITTLDSEGHEVQTPGIKIGDGTTYGIDLPFITDQYVLRQEFLNHINDTTKHVSDEDRTSWNNKISCHIDDTNLVFTIN